MGFPPFRDNFGFHQSPVTSLKSPVFARYPFTQIFQAPAVQEHP
jgi:hypothetical protein